jgi:4-hydroxy-2-oxoheptanedioate aldolase
MQLPANAFKRGLAAGRTQIGLWSSLSSSYTVEAIAGAGFDWLLLDAEHSVHDLESIERHVLAAHHAATDTELVVRVPAIDANLVKGLIDAGVRSFMFPYVQTVEEAKLAVAATRYPPAGIRGYSGSTRANRYGRDKTYNATYADDICVIVQIESPQAIDNIGAYGAIEGVDAMLVGANDLAANMGHLGNTAHADVVAALVRAGEAIVATGKAAGFQFFDASIARRLIGRGFTLAAVGGDMNALIRGMAGTLDALK